MANRVLIISMYRSGPMALFESDGEPLGSKMPAQLCSSTGALSAGAAPAAIADMTAEEMVGSFLRITASSRAPRIITRMSVSEVTVAIRCARDSSAISPKKSPAPSLAIRCALRCTRAVPETMTNRWRPYSPSRTRSLPAGTSSSSASDTTRRSPRFDTRENRGTLAKCCRIAWGIRAMAGAYLSIRATFQGPPGRTGTALAFGDLPGLLLELLEVPLAPAILRQQGVGPGEPPPGELHGDPSVHALELGAALRARAGRALPHPLDDLQPMPAGAAAVLVQRHVHRISTAPSTAADIRRPPWGNPMGIITRVWFAIRKKTRRLRTGQRQRVAPRNPTAMEPSPENSHRLEAVPWVPGIRPR